MQKRRKIKFKVRDITAIALFAALTAISSLIQIPLGPVPFTMQTFAVFLAAYVLGPIKGTISVAVYLLVGIAGVPVFSGFKSGPSALFGATGGFLIGFLFASFLSGYLLKHAKTSVTLQFLSMTAGLAVCYVFGLIWFTYIWAGDPSATLKSAFLVVVLPFIIPDLIKLFLAVIVGGRIVPLYDKYTSRENKI